MKRRTAKYTAALMLGGQLGLTAVSDIELGALYSLLSEAGYWWTDGAWVKERPQTSLFETGGDDPKPTGVYRLRLMGHPDDIGRALELIQKYLNVFEISELYPNRKGPGVRIYLTGKLPDGQ